jgi:hypothetical protein
MGEFLDSVVNGTLDFKALGEIFKGFFASTLANPGIAMVWEKVITFLRSLGIVFPLGLLALSLILLFLGKKLLSIERFIVAALVGYAIGVVIISPMINQVFALPDYISGAVIALVLAVLCKYIYFAVVAIAVGYSVYITCVNPEILPFTTPVNGNHLISLVIALVAVLVVFLLLKYIEMIGTSVLAAFCISRIVIMHFVDYRAFAFLGNWGWVAELVLVAIVGILGSVVQIKTRKRY